MFHRIRQHLSAGVESLRSTGLVGLFAFEFIVVLMGVLAAQGIQNWSRELEKKREILQVHGQLQRFFAASINDAEVLQAGLPCLRERVGEIMVSAAKGQELTDDFVSRPILLKLSKDSLPVETQIELAQVVGARRAGILASMPNSINTIEDATRGIVDKWELFRLMDPAFGPASIADRATVRAAGAEILSRLRSIEVTLTVISDLDKQLSIEDRVAYDRVNLPVRNCAEMWTLGTIYRLVEPDETRRD